MTTPSESIGVVALIFFKYLLFMMVAVVVIGFIIGLFTYGRPTKRSRNPSTLDDAADLGTALSHLLIKKMKDGSSMKRSGGNWLDDQQILAMLRGMSPSEFEELIAKMFKALGYKTLVVGGSRDGGIDIEMMKDGRHYPVQCKKFITRKVTPHDVRDFFGAMGDRRADGKGFFITTNIFTLEAERFAEGKPIELVDGTRLIGLVRESGVLGSSGAKPSSEATNLCPTCGGALISRTNKRTGHTFLGCSNFPKCRYTKTS